MNLSIPKRAKAGDVVYVISPSAGLLPFVKKRAERGIRHLEELGFTVKLATNASKNAGYISASPQDRVSDIHEAFLDDRCSMIIAAIGGNHSNQLLPLLDYELIRNNPKIFVGYSDNTVLHMAMFTQSNLQTYYGPCMLNQFGEYPEVLPYTLNHFKSVIMQGNSTFDINPSEHWTDEVLDWTKNQDANRPRELSVNSGYDWWKPGEARGWALPGALPSINHILCTKYFPDPKGAILMIDLPEGSDMFEGMPISDVDSWLTDLDNSEILSKINGMVICRPYKYTAEMVGELKDVILRILNKYDFPVLYNADFGHTDPMITIPIGATIRLDSKSKRFSLL